MEKYSQITIINVFKKDRETNTNGERVFLISKDDLNAIHLTNLYERLNTNSE